MNFFLSISLTYCRHRSHKKRITSEILRFRNRNELNASQKTENVMQHSYLMTLHFYRHTITIRLAVTYISTLPTKLRNSGRKVFIQHSRISK